MNSEIKLKINQAALYHKLTEEDSIKLRQLYNEIKSEIEVIIIRDSLPPDAWFPSEDFKYLIRQAKIME